MVKWSKVRTLRIVITRAWSALVVDGVNTFIFELGEALLKMNHEVHIISGCGYPLHKEKISYMFDVQKTPEIHILKEGRFMNRFDQVTRWFSHGNTLLKRLSPQLSIVNGVVPLTYKGPKIVVNHGLKTVGIYPSTQKLYDYFMYRTIGTLVAVSEPLRREIGAELGISDVKVIPIGLDVRKNSRLPREQRELAILHVGTRPVKNLQSTLKAFMMISKRIPDIKLYVTGGGANHYREFLVQSKLMDRIKFVGIISKRELRAMYSRVMAVSAPSFYEAMSYGILEAFASGTPVVSSRAMPPEFLVDGHNGYQIGSPIDWLALKSRLLDLLLDRSKWEHMSLNARATAVNYDISKVARAYLDCACELSNSQYAC